MEATTAHEVIDLTGLSESSEEDSEEEGEEEDSEEERGSDSEEDQSEGSDSDGENAEIPLNGTSRETLHDAIAAVSEARLRQIVIHLVDAIPGVEGALMQQLVTRKRKSQDIVSRWETCSNCEEEFDVGTSRVVDECSFHPGELEADEAKFPDWDESCHGPMDTPENQRDYPNQFVWTCCEKDGRSEGCVRGMHQPLSRKKRRM